MRGNANGTDPQIFELHHVANQFITKSEHACGVRQEFPSCLCEQALTTVPNQQWNAYFCLQLSNRHTYSSLSSEHALSGFGKTALFNDRHELFQLIQFHPP